jgi:membrane carboxypeptidase/penicillin-binding protein
MRRRTTAATAGILVFLLLTAAAYWAFLYDGDLPDSKGLSRFAPSSPLTVSDECLGESLDVIPFKDIGDAFRKVLPAAEPPETWPRQIAQSALCNRAQWSLGIHVIAEWRMVWRLERTFSQNQLLTIYANRAYFGERALGVNEASMHFVQKRPRDLSVDEAALLVGLIEAPEAYSPTKHPDHALACRNEVLRKMADQGALTAAEAAQFEARPIPKPIGELQRRIPRGEP